MKPVERFLNALGEQRALRLSPDVRHEVDQERIVVEHLLEVRDQPELVHRIAGEASTEVIVYAAHRHPLERCRHRGLRLVVAVADAAAPEQPEESPLRELRCAGDAAVDGIDGAGKTGCDLA